MVDGVLVQIVDTGPVDLTFDTPSTATLNLAIDNTGANPTSTAYIIDDVVVRVVP